MPTKEITELRKSGKLEDALQMAQAELLAKPDYIWAKRNISWVYYEYLKLNISAENFETFLKYLEEIKNLGLSVDAKMLFDNLSWPIIRMGYSLLKENPVNIDRFLKIFELIKSFQFSKPSETYSIIFKIFHKALKEHTKYIEFVDWWCLENFNPKDYENEQLPNGKPMMSLVEQAYIAYARHLLPQQIFHDEVKFDKEKGNNFLPLLDKIIDKYPQYQYLAYYKAKLLLALGDKENMLSAFLPFAKQKRNAFWVWDVLSDAFIKDEEVVLACYCKALSIYSPEEMLVSLRQRMAALFIKRNLFDEAKTEIELLVKSRNSHNHKIPGVVLNWQNQEWFKNAKIKKDNKDFYARHIEKAENLLFLDIPEETIIVEFVNTSKKMLNFIASESKYGFFKYEGFLNTVQIGDCLKVRFQNGKNGDSFRVYTVQPYNDVSIKSQFVKEIEGKLWIPEGKNHGIANNVFVHPDLITKQKLQNNDRVKGLAIKSFNQLRNEWGWKFFKIEQVKEISSQI